MSQKDYVETIKQAAVSMGTRLVFDFIVSKIPFLAGVIFNPILSWIIGKILSIAINQTEMGAFFLYVDLRTSAQGRAFEKAALAHANAKSDEEKKNAEKELIDTFRAFVKFTN